MSVVKKGGKKSVYNDFFIRILFIRIARPKSGSKTYLGAESFSRKKYAKFLAQTFANDKMTRISRGINFRKVEIYIYVLINYSKTKLLHKFMEL